VSTPSAAGTPCRACGADALALVKASNLPAALGAEDFAITDDRYGVTGAIYRCGSCSFMQCHDMSRVVEFYQSLEDPTYEAGRDQRLLQAQRLLEATISIFAKDARSLRLLDVGAGSGILVEAASRMGIKAEGVEPSSWLSVAARTHGCRVYHGVLPHPDAVGPYDVVTLIDVIEHVEDPLGLLKAGAALLAPDGLLAIVTPDVSSLAARLMGWRWWHFRVAHIGYFNSHTLALLCQRAGLESMKRERPAWYFSVSYLRQRLARYLPWWLLPKARWMDHFVVRLNLRDSLLLVCRRNGRSISER
jgi:2-polyprenyl-3-methyl-5-hydroxy-6-metoxy-1,4-benzoquinol methylase